MTLILKFLRKLGPFVMALATLVFFTVFSTLMGALSGWIVGWFFSDTILTFFSFLAGGHIGGLSMWEIGASLGFIGGFLRRG